MDISVKQQERIYALNGQLIRLKHKNTGKYLSSSSIKLQEKKSRFSGFQDTDKTLVSCGNPDLFSVWQVVRVQPPSEIDQKWNYTQTEINFDDPIMIRNYSNAEYLTIDKSNKSQVTEQGQIYCQPQNFNDEKQFFMIQRIDNPYKNDQVHDERIYSRSCVNVISFDSNFSLHSHDIKYKQNNAQELYEVTSFSNRDDNDEWDIILVDRNDLFSESRILRKNFGESNPRIKNFIFNQDKVIIRNSQYGWSLHSHNINYLTGSKLQEVTCRMDGLRDENDWWTIFKVHQDALDQQNQNLDNKIKNIQRIKLFHVQTKQFLTTSTGEKAPSGNYQEVTCYKKQSKDEFQISALKTIYNVEQENLLVEQPFLIIHVKTNTFLTCHRIPSQPTSFQYEVALRPDITHGAIWQIEQTDSIFV